jgi:hypothetical protein
MGFAQGSWLVMVVMLLPVQMKSQTMQKLAEGLMDVSGIFSMVLMC